MLAALAQLLGRGQHPEVRVGVPGGVLAYRHPVGGQSGAQHGVYVERGHLAGPAPAGQSQPGRLERRLLQRVVHEPGEDSRVRRHQRLGALVGLVVGAAEPTRLGHVDVPADRAGRVRQHLLPGGFQGGPVQQQHTAGGVRRQRAGEYPEHLERDGVAEHPRGHLGQRCGRVGAGADGELPPELGGSRGLGAGVEPQVGAEPARGPARLHRRAHHRPVFVPHHRDQQRAVPVADPGQLGQVGQAGRVGAVDHRVRAGQLDRPVVHPYLGRQPVRAQVGHLRP
ncbi:hypothetical protein GCM10027614_00960 [Micromonospora vulcania]